MIKFVCPLRKREDLSFEEFKSYYENYHSKLIRLVPSASRYIRRYARNFADETGASVKPDFDVLTEIWFEDQAAFDAGMASFADPEAIALLRADEVNLFDTSYIRTCVVEECESDLSGNPS